MGEWEHKRIGDLLFDVCQRDPEKEAVVFTGKRLNYRDLLTRTKNVASGLLKLGMEKGDKVGVLCPNIPEWPLTELACMLIGSVCVPVNMMYRLTELEYTLRQADVKTLIMIERYMNADFLDMIYQICPEFKEGKAGELRSEKMPLLRNLITLNDTPQKGMWSFRQLEKNLGERGLDENVLKGRMEQVTSDDIALIQYTSGTTAFPKGVMLHHEGIIANSYWHFHRLKINSSDRIFSVFPFYHVGGSVSMLIGTLNTGATLFMTERFDPLDAMKTIQDEKCTVMFGLDTMYLVMMGHPDYEAYDLSSLIKGTSSGNPEALKKIATSMGIKGLSNVYGLSENSSLSTIGLPDDPIEKRCMLNGVAIPGTEIKIVDPDTRKTLPPGTTGEICLKGVSIMKGYYKKPKETAEALDEEGWLSTGDLGRLDEKGYLQFLGRIKDSYRVGGENVSALEIEEFLMQHAKVLRACAIGVPDQRLIEVGMVFIELQPGKDATEEEMIEYCKGSIAPFKVPRYVKFTADFPMTGSGKIQKYVLRDQIIEELELSK
ncbi:AMP-binding protein [Thermodesulfobacteriota bacterium]